MPVNEVRRLTLGDGVVGTNQTISEMSKIAMGKYGAASPKIRNLTIDVVRAAGVPEKDKLGEMLAVHNWVMNHLRYVNDPYGTEFITYPETLAFERQDGDCDDHVILESAMLGSIGIPTRYITVGFNGKPFSHVYLGAIIKGELIPLDPIMKTEPAGWEAPNPTSKHVYPVNTPNGTGLGEVGSRESGTLLALLIAGLFFFSKRGRNVRSR